MEISGELPRKKTGPIRQETGWAQMWTEQRRKERNASMCPTQEISHISPAVQSTTVDKAQKNNLECCAIKPLVLHYIQSHTIELSWKNHNKILTFLCSVWRLQRGWTELLLEHWEPMLLLLFQFPLYNVMCCQRKSATQYISVQQTFSYSHSKKRNFNTKPKMYRLSIFT